MPEGVKVLKKHAKFLKKQFRKPHNFVTEIRYKGKAYYILRLTRYDEETLLHEIIHYKQVQWRLRIIKDEPEFESYFITQLFRDLKCALTETN